MNERWVAIDSDFRVSSRGRVQRTSAARTRKAGRFLAGGLTSKGYREVTMQANGKKRRARVHVLVAEAFLGPKPSPAHEVNHKNGNKDDNRVSNLEWATHAENCRHALATGLRVPHGLSPSDQQRMRTLWATRPPNKHLPPEHPLSRASVAAQFGVSKTRVSQIVRGS